MSMFNFQEQATPEEIARTERRCEKTNQFRKDTRSKRKCDLIFEKQLEYMWEKYGGCMKVEEVAKELKISKDLVYDLLNKKQLHSKKAGDRRVVPTADLVYWLIYDERG